MTSSFISKILSAFCVSALVSGTALFAQSASFQDDGLPAVSSLLGAGGFGAPLGTGCTPTSLTTHFNDGNGSGGNMFDIIPNFNMFLRCMDVHTSAPAGSTVNFELWYKIGTCEGNSSNQSLWTQLLVTTTVSAGSGNPTRVDISSIDVVFEAGVTYGIYMIMDSTRYTNGPTGSTQTDFVNADLTLSTFYGIGGNWGPTYSPREWNGTLFYEPAKPSLAVSNLISGGVTTLKLSNMTPGNEAYFVMSQVGFGSTVTPYATFALAAPLIALPPPPLPLLVDLAGTASLSITVPATAMNRSVYLQGIEISLSENRLSDAIEAVVQ